jgi:hypothetical protein
MPLHVAEVFKEKFNDYDLSVIHHFKAESQKDVNKAEFVQKLRESYPGSLPGPVKGTIAKIKRLSDSEFDELMASIGIDS